MTEIQMTMQSKLKIVDNRVLDSNVKGKGIGSAGIFIMKELAKRLRCNKITGRKKAIPDTPEERAKLTAFYAKNGFSQNEDTDEILFDMKDYKDHTQDQTVKQSEASPLEVPDTLEDIRAKAFDQGIDAGIQSVVIRMLKAGKFNLSDLADASGLCLEEVSRLKDRLDNYYPICSRPEPSDKIPST